MKYVWIYILIIINIILFYVSYNRFKIRSNFEYMLGSTELIDAKLYEQGNFSIILSKGKNYQQENTEYYRIIIHTKSNPVIPLSVSLDPDYNPMHFLIPRKEETREMLVDENGDGIIDGILNNNSHSLKK